MSSNTTTTQPDLVDVRGPRFAAWITTAVLVLALVVSAVNPLVAAVILAVQAVIFAIGAVGGPRKHPYGRRPVRRHRHRGRPGGRVPQCGLRHLPGLPALSAGGPFPTPRASHLTCCNKSD